MRITARIVTASTTVGFSAAALIGLAPTAGAAASAYRPTDGPVWGGVVGINHRGDLLVSIYSAGPEAALARPGRTPIPLLAPDGSVYAEAEAINNAGVSVGSARGTDLATRPTQWSATGVATVLAPPSGDDVLYGLGAVDINNRGVVVGGDSDHVVVWTSPTTPRIVALKGAVGPAYAQAINDRGVIAARVSNHAALIGADGRVRPLGRAAGEIYSIAEDVNNNGVAIGTVETSAGYFPVLWDADGTLHRIGGASTSVFAIADDGTVVGTVFRSAPAGDRAFVRSAAGVVTYLRPLPGGEGAGAGAINDLGVVAGGTDVGRYTKATVWTPSS